MRIHWTDHFKKDYKKLPAHLKKQTLKKLELLISSPRHPSLQVKKMKGEVVFEARVTQGYRIIFIISADTYSLLRVGPHDILRKI